MNLYFKVENIGGINFIEENLDFKELNTKLIYAPNGTGKTSLSKAFEINERNKVKKEKKYQIKVSDETFIFYFFYI